MRCTGLFRREHWQHRALGELHEKGADGRWRVARDANLLSKV
jgi:ketosteroid isomerase-like protein